MKKYIVILLFCFLFLPSLVIARGEPPVFINYTIKVTDTNGIILKTNDKDINIPYNTTLEVMYEYELDGKLYANVEYNDNVGMIEVKGVELVSKDVDFDKYKSEEEKKIYVFGEGTYLYNGPSLIYGKVDGDILIPPYTTLTYTYGDDAWVYVTYNGKKGWVYIYTYDDIIYEKGAYIASVYDNKKIYTLTDIKLIDSPITKNEKDLTIPKYKEVKYKYTYSKDPYTTYYYLIYDNIEGWYKYTPLEVADMYDEDFIVNSTEDVDIYEKPLIDSTILGKISKDEEYNIIAIALKDSIEYNTYESWSYVKYKDITGWIHYFEKGKEQDIVNNNTENKVQTNNNKPSDSTKIILFSVSMIIIILFIMFTILKFNKTKKEEM